MSDTETIETTAIEPVRDTGVAALTTYDRRKVNLIKQTIMPGATDEELQMYVEFAVRTGLDPLTRQIHAFSVWNADAGRKVFQFSVGIDGLRLVAERTGEYLGQDGPWWCGPDGKWTEVWLAKDPPAAAKVTVHRVGRRPMSRIVKYVEFVRLGRNNLPIGNWADRPVHMLAIRAESHALRAAFPRDMAGLQVDYDADDADGYSRPRVLDPDAPVTNYQLGALHGLAKALGFDDDERHERAGVASFSDLKRGPASTLIDQWQHLLETGEDLQVEDPNIVDAELVDEPDVGAASDSRAVVAHGDGASDTSQRHPQESGSSPAASANVGEEEDGATTSSSADDPPAPDHIPGVDGPLGPDTADHAALVDRAVELYTETGKTSGEGRRKLRQAWNKTHPGEAIPVVGDLPDADLRALIEAKESAP